MFGFVKKLFKREQAPDPVALVMLQTEPRVLTRGHVAQAIAQATEAPFDESGVVEEQFSYHRLHVRGFELTVASAPGPYIPKDRAPSGDLRLDDVIVRHEAAILIDCWAAPPGVAREESTDLMGLIVAALADDTTLGVFCFHTQRLNVADEKLMTMLAAGQGAEAMATHTSDAIVGVANADALMNAAIDEARARWPEFVAAFAKRKAGDAAFIVKARFGEGDASEHMWLTVDTADATGATGILQSQPFGLPRPRKGDRVEVELDRLSDWIALVDGEPLGNFSQAAIEAAQHVR